MGNKKSLIVIVFSLFVVGCKPHEMGISGITLTENSMVIEITDINGYLPEYTQPYYTVGVRYDSYRQGGFFGTVEEERFGEIYSIKTITMDLTDVPRVVYDRKKPWKAEYQKMTNLYINEEALISIRFGGSALYATVFIEKDKIHILSQEYTGRWLFSRYKTLYTAAEDDK
jgi:hypothetical protein